MSAEYNTSDASALLFYLDFKFVNKFKKNAKHAGVLNVYFNVLYKTV